MEISSVLVRNSNQQTANSKNQDKRKLKMFLCASAMSALYLAGKVSGKDTQFDTSKVFPVIDFQKFFLNLNDSLSSKFKQLDFLIPNSIVDSFAGLKKNISSSFVNFGGIFDKKNVHQG